MKSFRASRLRIATLLLILPMAAVCVPDSSSQAAPKYGNSLDWVPADVAFYTSSLRGREQIEIIANSKAWAKLNELPAVQTALTLAQFTLHQPGGPLDQVHQFFADPENKDLWDLVVDGFSHEVLLYGDSRAADFADIALRTMNAVQYGSVVADLQADVDDEIVTGRILLNSLEANRERLQTPGLVIGFKLTDSQRAGRQLKRLEAIAKAHLDDQPQFRGRLKRATVAGVEYLTLELDGSMVPWHEVPWEKLAERPGQYDALRAKLQGMKLVVTLGVRDDYLLLTVGNSTEHLAALGTGKLLADAPELKPLEKFVKHRLIDINYVSKAMMQAASNTQGELDDITKFIRQVLPEAGLPEELNARLVKDTEALASDLKGAIPEVGASCSFSFLTPQGIEGYNYDWSQNLYLDGSKPLTLLNHAGGNPLLAVASRARHSPQQYEMLRKWATKAFGYFEELGVPQFSPEEQQQYAKIKAAALPLIERLDKATGQMLLPALAEGQTAVVLDAKLTSEKWFEGLPQGGKSLPMLEVGFVFGVSDAALLRKACAEYQAIAAAVLEKIKELNPDDIPADFKLPQPETREVKIGAETGVITWYKLPDDIGIDSQLTPNSGLSPQVAVLSLSPKQTARLLADMPLAVTADGPLADRRRPLASAAYFNWAGTVDAATPWIDFLVRQFGSRGLDAAGLGLFLADDDARTKLAQAADDDPSTSAVLEQVHTVLDVLKTLRTVESATYADGGALVSHWLTVFRDVP